jgi:adenosylhomocysteine nucleosidase
MLSVDTLSVDTGFVFALRQESVGILDRLKRSQTTRGNGWTFHTGKLDTGKLDNVSVAVVLSGIGQKNAEEATNTLLDVFAPKLICSLGYAGGLSSRLKQSNICVPEQIVRHSDRQTLDLSNPIPQKSLPMPNKLTLLTVNSVVELPEQKRALHEQTGAEIVDMESFAVAEVCRIREIPFLSVRIIFDAVEDRIPSDITHILDSMGKGVSRFSGTLLGSVWSRPSVVRDFVSLKRRAFTATERLARFTVAELSRRQTTDRQRQITDDSRNKTVR